MDPKPSADHPVHGGEEGAFDPAPHRPTSRGLTIAAIVGACVLLALVAVGTIPRLLHHKATREERESAAGDSVRVIVTKPTRIAAGAGVLLPGSIRPVQETVVYARTNGYVRSYKVDIGDKVRAGQILAEIDVPEVDQELRQSRATANQTRAMVEQAKAQLELARTENKRYIAIRPSGVVSQQETEERQAKFDVQGANVEAAAASVGSAEANVSRLEELKNFATVVSPLDGTVTSRNIEVGQLVMAGIGAGQAVYRIAKTNVVRVFVHVPQLYAPSVSVGGETSVTVREYPHRLFKGKVTRTSNELETATRTLLTEIRIDNPDASLIAGMYAQVTLPIERADAPLVVPSTALVFNADGTRVAVVRNGQIQWHAVQVTDDMGNSLSIAGGIHENDDVVMTPGDHLVEGAKVRTEELGKP
jgi:RND family efflux transporter MFP subunit